LETENDDGDENPPNYLSENVYHPRVALKSAIRDWLPDFSQEKRAFGPLVKPQPLSALTPIIPPIIPKINTCISLTLTTNSSAIAPLISDVTATQLHALADICSTVSLPITEAQLKSSVMNSLVSETKVVTTDAITGPILSTSISDNNIEISEKNSPNPPETMEIEKTISNEPSEATEELMDCGTPKHTLSDNSSLNSEPPVVKEEEASNNANGNLAIDQESENKAEKSQLSDDIVMADTSNELETAMQDESISEDEKLDAINFDDILLLCDLFYLPFEHGEKFIF
jgi:protein O-GlcNAcase / histone acetyltransferase